MKKLILLVGAPGSGKTTLSKKYVEEGFVRVNQDDQGKDHVHIFDMAIIDGHNVVVDRMGFSKEQRRRYLEVAKMNGYETEIIILYVPYATCLRRAIDRTDHPTVKDEETAKKAVHYFFSKYEKVQDNEADKITKIGQNGIVPAIICDLDGTLCEIEHRRHYVRNGEKNWKMFFQEMDKDTPKMHVVDILERFNSTHSIIFCSGRPKDYTEKTKAWLFDNLPPIVNWQLFMREHGDHRPDDIIKEIILDFEILTRYKPFFSLDDRDNVVKMWRTRGIPCLQVEYGDF